MFGLNAAPNANPWTRWKFKKKFKKKQNNKNLTGMPSLRSFNSALEQRVTFLLRPPPPSPLNNCTAQPRLRPSLARSPKSPASSPQSARAGPQRPLPSRSYLSTTQSTRPAPPRPLGAYSSGQVRPLARCPHPTAPPTDALRRAAGVRMPPLAPAPP